MKDQYGNGCLPIVRDVIAMLAIMAAMLAICWWILR